jgi:hypothetical protein
MRDRVSDVASSARPYVDRVAHDEKLHENVKNAYESARKIYESMFVPAGATGMAVRVASDKDTQEELRRVVEELRQAARRARGEESHAGRKMTLLIAGITLGVLFNPITGPDARRWVKEKIFGPEEPFEFQTSDNQSSSS